MSTLSRSRFLLVLVLIAIPILAGSQCVFIFSSGDGSNDDDKDKEQVVVVANGNLVGTTVAGANYVSGSISGITGSNGEFQYEVGHTVQFSIGDIPLGQPVEGKPAIAPVDLVAGSSPDATDVVNITRLLQSLDSDPADATVTIPADVRKVAIRSNPGVSAAIEYLDYADDTAFLNAASQLVAVLTRDYPFTAVLVDADAARAQVNKSAKN